MQSHKCDREVEFNKFLNGDVPRTQVICITPCLRREVYYAIKVFDKYCPVPNDPDHDELSYLPPPGSSMCPSCGKET